MAELQLGNKTLKWVYIVLSLVISSLLVLDVLAIFRIYLSPIILGANYLFELVTGSDMDFLNLHAILALLLISNTILFFVTKKNENYKVGYFITIFNYCSLALVILTIFFLATNYKTSPHQ